MTSVINSVAKEPISPQKVVTLPFLDLSDDIVTLPISSEKEAREILVDIRGF
ncbi:MAG TPA: hypothetical protein VNR38_00850 [Ureibacillus sp.]|nr:hypothetical protein [Ureibacillus sp.]